MISRFRGRVESHSLATSGSLPSPMGAPSIREQIQEFFTLRRTEREASAFPDAVRLPLERSLSLAFQRREAAETLWPRGSMAEGMSLARSAIAVAASALDEAAASLSSPPSWFERARTRTNEANARAVSVKLPVRETDVLPADEPAFREMIDAVVALEEAAANLLGGAAAVAQLRRQRLVASTLFAVVVMVLLVWLVHAPLFSHAVASAEFMPSYGAAQAIDEDTKTYWALPDHQPGWIDLFLPKPRTVATVRVAQGNPPYSDRATRDARIETFLGETLLKGVDVTLPEPPKGQVSWTDVRIDSPKCDRVRFTVKTFYQVGGALVEVEVK